MFRQIIFSLINKAEFSTAEKIINIVLDNLILLIEKNYPSVRNSVEVEFFEFGILEQKRLKDTLATIIINCMGKEGYKTYQSASEIYKTYFRQTIANEYIKIIGLTEMHCLKKLKENSPVLIGDISLDRYGDDTAYYSLTLNNTPCNSVEKLQPLLAGIFSTLILELVSKAMNSHISLLPSGVINMTKQCLLFSANKGDSSNFVEHHESSERLSKTA